MKIFNENADVRTWYRLPLRGKGCVASNGKPYSITLKKGTTNNLLINFFGGGLSWNAETAAKPMNPLKLISGAEAFYIPYIPNIQLNLIHVGIFNAKDKRSPFYDWNILNIPYSTADFHLGNNQFAYGGGKMLHHGGAKNVAAALEFAKNYFPATPDKLVISGQSAGAFGCVAHAPKIANLYPDCGNVTVYSEGSHLHAPIWGDVARNVWKVDRDLGEYIKTNDLIADLFRYAMDNMPDHTKFLHSNSVWDGIPAKFMNKMNNVKWSINRQALDEFHSTLLDVTRGLKGNIKNYHFFLTDHGKNKKGATPHLFSGNPKLIYNKIQDGTSLRDWLCGAIDGKPTHVGEKFLEEIK
ncbi:MAG: pectinacetylesterase family protein [Defluviitaleaceae bacterium]|nr:pectinacetylesterase family protein [Defluviitaleaceae bacterium]